MEKYDALIFTRPMLMALKPHHVPKADAVQSRQNVELERQAMRILPKPQTSVPSRCDSGRGAVLNGCLDHAKQLKSAGPGYFNEPSRSSRAPTGAGQTKVLD
jgi:hypothetical protein